jgi:hypothetical protein
MDSSMFDRMISGLLVIGAIAGVALCGLALLSVWLFYHVSIHWIA